MITEKDTDGKPLPGNYSGKEDIYIKNKKEQYNEQEIKNKQETEEDKWNEVDAERAGRKVEARDADNLDVPGAELDDAMENIGEEDEENNYYSIGGDNHENLEESSRG